MSDVVSPLAADFEASPENTWRNSIAKLLGSRSLDELHSRTEGGLDIRPLYVDRPEPLARVASRQGPWSSCLIIPAAAAHAATQSALEGLSTVELSVEPDDDLVAQDVQAFLATAGAAAVPAIANFGASTPNVKTLSALRSASSFVVDVCGAFEQRAEVQRHRIQHCLRDYDATTLTMRADGERFQALGATEPFEIALAVAGLLQYLRIGEEAGASITDLLLRSELQLSVDADIFTGIAKLRATRRIWSTIASRAGIRNELNIRSMTARRMMTSLEPLNNLLRTTTACIAGVFGGANAVSILPHDWTSTESSEAATRLARNIQIMLRDESNLAHVTDPASGSFYVEHLSNELAEDAWGKFQRIEKQGGLFAFVESGDANSMLNEMAEKRSEKVQHRKIGMIGVNEFAFLDASTQVRSRQDQSVRRDAAPFEELRTSADHIMVGSSPPAVVLVQIGAPAEYGNNTSIAVNAYAAGGVDTIAVPANDDEALAKAASRSAVACICGPTDAALDTVGPLCDRLRRLGFVELHSVGAPFGEAGQFGIESFISTDSNLYRLLSRTQERIAGASR